MLSLNLQYLDSRGGPRIGAVGSGTALVEGGHALAKLVQALR